MKTIIAASISAALAVATANAETSDEKTTMQKKSAYGPDNTSELRREPCPDYFDSDWANTNKNHPCLKAIGDDGSMPDYVEVPVAQETGSTTDARMETETRTADTDFGTRSDDMSENVCSTENLSDEAIANNDYARLLNASEERERAQLSEDFSPSNDTAKSVTQLRDNDLKEEHYVATFEALDDNGSDTIDKGEALGVRGLADIFEEVDYNNDGVLTAAEFELHFAGTVYTGEGLCIDGERVSSASELDRNYNASL